MRRLQLTQGYFAIVDDDDYERLSRYNWYARKSGNAVYASRCIRRNGIKTTLSLHCEILGKIPGLVIDHINGDGLDNRKENLRHVTTRQNAQNRHAEKSSKYPGVFWDSHAKRWRAMIKVNGKKKYLGSHNEEKEAFNAYCDASFVFAGEKVLEQII